LRAPAQRTVRAGTGKAVQEHIGRFDETLRPCIGMPYQHAAGGFDLNHAAKHRLAWRFRHDAHHTFSAVEQSVPQYGEGIRAVATAAAKRD
jgi:hypothetical protein